MNLLFLFLNIFLSILYQKRPIVRTCQEQRLVLILMISPPFSFSSSKRGRSAIFRTWQIGGTSCVKTNSLNGIDSIVLPIWLIGLCNNWQMDVCTWLGASPKGIHWIKVSFQIVRTKIVSWNVNINYIETPPLPPKATNSQCIRQMKTLSTLWYWVNAIAKWLDWLYSVALENGQVFPL